MTDQNEANTQQDTLPVERPDGEIKFLDLDTYVPKFVTIRLKGIDYKIHEAATETMLKVDSISNSFKERNAKAAKAGKSLGVVQAIENIKDQIEVMMKDQYPEFSRKDLDGLKYSQVILLLNQLKDTLVFLEETLGSQDSDKSETKRQ